MAGEGWGILSKPGDPHGGSWGRRLGALWCPVYTGETPMAVPGEGGWEGWGVLSKLERTPTQWFLGEAAGEGWGILSKPGDPHSGSWRRQLGRVGVSCLNWRDPHGSSWGRRLGVLGCLV